MKKLFLVLLIMISIQTIQAQTLWFNAISFTSRTLPDGEWHDVVPTKIPVAINGTDRHIEIFSQEKQIIDHRIMQKFEMKEGIIFSAYGTDSNYNIIFISVYLLANDITFLEVSYEGFEYRYQLEDADLP